jgi:hypothetical protein
MKCFEVKVNGEKLCTAGIGDDGVLTTVVSFAKRSNSTDETAQDSDNPERLHLRVSGVAGPEPGVMEHLEWLDQSLSVGDEITIRIVETPECDKPNNREETPIECSFCRKRQDQVEKLIAGPAVFICNECVGDCSAALAKREPSGSITTIIETSAETTCSFCGQKPVEVDGIVGVENASICSKCVKICDEVLANDV